MLTRAKRADVARRSTPFKDKTNVVSQTNKRTKHKTTPRPNKISGKVERDMKRTTRSSAEHIDAEIVNNVTAKSNQIFGNKRKMQLKIDKQVQDVCNGSKASKLGVSKKVANEKADGSRQIAKNVVKRRRKESTGNRKEECNKCINKVNTSIVESKTIKQDNKASSPKSRRKKAEKKLDAAATTNDVLKSNDKKCLRKLKPVNYRDSLKSQCTDNSVEEKSTKKPEKSDHIPIYKRQLEESPKSQKKIIDVYDFFSDDKQTNKKKKRKVSDVSFKVRLRNNPKKVTWVAKAKETLERLGLNVNSKTLHKDIEKLIEAKVKALQNESTATTSDVSQMLQQKTYASSHSISNKSEENNKINIISQFVVPPPPQFRSNQLSSNTSNDSLNISHNPVANSTLIHDNHESSMPWRPILPVKSNPHLLKIKPTSLPSVEQDIILDATFTERVASNSDKPISTENKTPRKTNVQPTILSFISNSRDDGGGCNDSLFNIDEYSPFKNQATQTDLDNSKNISEVINDTEKRNSAETSKNYGHAKRNILKEISNIEQTEKLTAKRGKMNVLKDTPLDVKGNSVNESTLGKDVNDYFGFISADENTAIIKEQNLVSPKVAGKVKSSVKPVISAAKLANKNENDQYGGDSKQQKKMKVTTRKTIKHKENAENILPNKTTRSKRKKTQISFEKRDGVSNYFGFDSDESDNAKSNIPKLLPKAKTNKNEPTRIPVVLLVNIIKRIDKNDLIFVDEYSRYSGKFEVDKKKNISDAESETEQTSEDEQPEVPLFMDLKLEKPRRSYQRKHRRLPRRQSVVSENEESNYSNIVHRNKKPKKEWDEEAEKWAEHFNSVCKEIEDYDLEIE